MELATFQGLVATREQRRAGGDRVAQHGYRACPSVQ